MREKDSFALAVQTMKLREKKRRFRLWAGRALLVLFIAWLLSFVFGIFIVQGDSMRPSYRDGDLVFMIRVLPKGVTYDNVVILEDAEGKEVIKRIVGLPGDTITLYDNGQIVRNQIAVPEQDIIYSAAASGTWQTYTVPENAYFYLGDNRPVSKDSRQNGCADKAQIKGKVLATFRR